MRVKLLMGILCTWAGLDMIREAIRGEIAVLEWRSFLREQMGGDE